MHPVEAAWHKFRTSDDHALLTRSRQSYLDCVGFKACPAEVPLPVAMPWNLVAARDARARCESTGSYVKHLGLDNGQYRIRVGRLPPGENRRINHVAARMIC